MQNPLDLIAKLTQEIATLKQEAAELPAKLKREAQAFALREVADAQSAVADMLRKKADEVEAGQ